MDKRAYFQLIFKTGLILAISILLACSPAENINSKAPTIRQNSIQKSPFSSRLNDWPHSISDMAPDPRVKFGRLDNGLRYAILPIPDDKGVVSIQMSISSGFKDEPENLYGIAHLLEHIVFRGTNKDEEQSIIHDMQTLGAGIGFDLNGFTAKDNTFYTVNLASAKFDKISVALENFSRLVMKPKLTKEYLALEKKVVLTELQQRESIQGRAWQDREQFKYPDQKRKKFPGIGTHESLAAITLEDIDSFYDAHYRPENTLLIITGGVNLSKTEDKLKKLFSAWPKRTKLPPAQDNHAALDISTFPKVKHYVETGAKTQFNLIENTPSTLQNDTLENQKKLFAERITNAMITNRLKPRIEAQKNVSWINLHNSRNENYDIRSVAMGAKDYIIASTLFEEERLRAIKYGFTKEEVALALEAELAFLKRKNEKPKFINAWSEASRLRSSFSNRKVYRSPAQQLSHFHSFSESLSLKDYHVMAKSLWSDFNPRYWTQSGKSMNETLEKIKVKLANISEADISKPIEFEADVLKDIDLGYGSIINRDVFSKEKVNRLLFANGVRLNYKQRESEKDDIQIVVTLKGDFTEFAPRYASIVEQASTFTRADIKGVTKSEMDRQFVGQKANFVLKMSGKKLAIYASTRAEDLETVFNIITSFITNVDLKSQSRKQKFDQKISNIRTNSQNSPVIAGSLQIPYIYSGKADSFLSKTGGVYTSEDKTLESIQTIIDSGNIEVGVVGDFSPNSLEGLFTSTLGALPTRTEVIERPHEFNDITHIKPGVTNLTYDGSAKQMAVFYCWPLEPGDDLNTEIVESLSAQVIKNRIIQRFREELGLAYSPNITGQSNPAFPNFKYSCFTIQFSPEKETLVHENFKNILDELSKKPVSKTELARAREPIISLLDRFSNSNFALAESVALAYSEPNYLKKKREFLPALEKIHLRQLNHYISRNYFLLDAHIFRIESPRPLKERQRQALEIEAGMGRADAQYALGKLLKASAVDEDKMRALSLFEASAAQNHKKAHFALGRHYALAKEKLTKAANHLKQAEDPREGTFLLAEIYFRNPDLFPDITEAKIMELYLKSSEKGYSYAQQALAQRYKDGAIIKRDRIRAFKWALLSRSSTKKLIKNRDSQFLKSFEKELTLEEQEKAIKLAEDWVNSFNDDLN